MKIAIDAREYTTGTGRYMYRLIEHLQKIDSEHDYVILLKPEDMNASEFVNPKFVKVACPHKEFTFSEQIGFKKQLEALKPDLVHFGMVQQPIWYKGKVVTTMQDLTTIRFRNPTKNPLIFTIKQQVYKWVNKRAAEKSVAIITPSQFVKDDVVNYTGVSADKITVTHEAAEPIMDKLEPVDELMHKQFLLYIGRPLPHKNLWRLIQAFDKLHQKYPDLYLALAGKKDALYEQIANKAEQEGIDKIVFTGFVSEGQLRWMYEHTAAYTFPSLSEGFGLPALEAMANGAPVVSSNATCSPEIYGDAAHYFDPLNVDAITTAIDEVLTDVNLRTSMIELGYIQATKYSWQRMAEQTLAVYNAALEP